MAKITVLDDRTIDHIAAGEVVERPASVVKELVENACDAGATAITVEIKEGGISFIRVTDNGIGIEKGQVQNAFLRHATSKIRTVEDLSHIQSMGFRGEALSSIAAVGMVELITKTKEALTGVRYRIEGEREREFSEVGAPVGTTAIVRDLFFHTPARRKFLKTAATEGGYVADLMEHMAMARPDISFQFVMNQKDRFSTSGSGDLKEVIYRIYGREIAKEVFAFSAREDGIRLEGLLGTPQLVRPNRNFEFFFVNRRYIKSRVLSKGLEGGYDKRLMQHKFPMACLHMTLDCGEVDVNVHPSKMEVRFSDNQKIFDMLEQNVARALREREMIPAVTFSVPKEENGAQKEKEEAKALAAQLLSMPRPTAGEREGAGKDVSARRILHADGEVPKKALPHSAYPDTQPKLQSGIPQKLQEAAAGEKGQKADSRMPQPFEKRGLEAAVRERQLEYQAEEAKIAQGTQLDLFGEKILTQKAVQQYELIGQVFGTYWIAVYQDKLILIDQHAAHEKVKYETILKKVREGGNESQNLMPPQVVTLSPKEARLLLEYRQYFAQLGFEIEEFGGNSFSLRSVPCDLYGNFGADLLQEMLEELAGWQKPKTPAAVTERIATMACKSAVKGNHRMSREEMAALLDQLLSLDNPYQCPHGRPTMITMTRQELEKRFKRIV